MTTYDVTPHTFTRMRTHYDEARHRRDAHGRFAPTGGSLPGVYLEAGRSGATPDFGNATERRDWMVSHLPRSPYASRAVGRTIARSLREHDPQAATAHFETMGDYYGRGGDEDRFMLESVTRADGTVADVEGGVEHQEVALGGAVADLEFLDMSHCAVRDDDEGVMDMNLDAAQNPSPPAFDVVQVEADLDELRDAHGVDGPYTFCAAASVCTQLSQEQPHVQAIHLEHVDGSWKVGAVTCADGANSGPEQVEPYARRLAGLGMDGWPTEPEMVNGRLRTSLRPGDPDMSL